MHTLAGVGATFRSPAASRETEGSPHPRFLREHRCGPVRTWSPLRMTDGGAPCTLLRACREPVLSHHRGFTSFIRVAGVGATFRSPAASRETESLPRPRFLRGRRWFRDRAWSPPACRPPPPPPPPRAPPPPPPPPP